MMSKIQESLCSVTDEMENTSDDEDETLTYAQQRAKRMKKNEEMFDILGVNNAVTTLANSFPKKPLVKKNKPKSVKSVPNRRSRRLAHKPPTHGSSQNGSGEIQLTKVKSTILNPKEKSNFLEKLKDDLAVKEAVNDFHMLPQDKFVHVLRSLDMNEPTIKVTESRIYSLAIHPSETSLLVAAGDMRGNIGFYNKSDSEIFKLHDGPVNCVSFCTWDPYKLFSTSHDGSVRYGDILQRTFDVIYNTEWKDKNKSKINHSTWHTEFERNLLIGNGSGHVDMIDTRTSHEAIKTAWCHERSVRTVQCHPLQKHYFLTSSGIGEVSLWDIRNMTDKSINPVLQFEHPRSLTSAFFSASGTKMVSTCNDDKIRVFNTEKLNADSTNPLSIIKHDNHTGRWLSVFKAKWNPGRDDTFFIGSLQVPKRMEVYNCDGHIMHNLISTNMTTYCSVIEVHPTQAIYVGGNASGRLHIFSTKEQLT